MINEAGRQEMNESGRNRNNGKWLWLTGLVALSVILAGFYWWHYVRGRVSTDNAYVVADNATVSSRVPGTIVRIHVENDDAVEAGDVVVELDQSDYQVKVDEARAALERIKAQIELAKVSLQLTDDQTASQVKAAEAVAQAARDKANQVRHLLDELKQKQKAAKADYKHAKRDFERYSNLYRRGAVSEQQRDRARTLLKKTKAQLDGVTAEIGGAQATLAAALQDVDRAVAQLAVARSARLQVSIERHKLKALIAQRAQIRAQLKTAQLYLSYCTIRAPISGYVAQKHVQIGDRLQPGQPILAIIPLRDVYVEANFKETQLKDVRIGQPAEIRADVYPDHRYEGIVAGIRAGTGAAFALLPPENATGNWIKVVQRVPVRIQLREPPPKEFPLRVGLSLEVTIYTSNKTGEQLLPRHADSFLKRTFSAGSSEQMSRAGKDRSYSTLQRGHYTVMDHDAG